MFGQQNKLKELFPENGWELVEAQVPNYDWIAEIWLIKSVWSANDCYVFISFEVDPQWGDRNNKKEGVRAINLSLQQPDFWRNDNVQIDFVDEEKIPVYIKPQFEKSVSEIFDCLNNLRLKFKNLK